MTVIGGGGSALAAPLSTSVGRAHLNNPSANKSGGSARAEETIKVHRARVMRKMAVRSVAELTRIAELVGVQPEP